MNRPLASLAGATFVALIVLCVAWELWLAPLRPGGTALVLKVLPLLFLLRGVLAGRNQSLQWSVLLIWVYVTEGLVRAASDPGLSALLGGIETALALTYFVVATAILRPQKQLARQKDRTHHEPI
ncbi:MAG: DUF2069 domain-containing protein [Burkholderiales bacterium]|nr:DUF2069 domain-containing protein [Burkholderiales bacterium]